MTITFLGTASGMPVPDRHHSALLVETGRHRFLFDVGEGASKAFLAHQIPYDSVDAIFLSHTHADHIGGLPLLLQAMYLTRRIQPLSLYCPADRVNWLTSFLHGCFILPEKWTFTISILSVPARMPFPDGNAVEAFENSHLDRVKPLAEHYGIGATSLSFLIRSSEGTALYSSDIGGISDLQYSIHTSDCLILDSTHVSSEEVLALAKEYPEKTFLCTHIPPEAETRVDLLNHFPHNVFLAYDGLKCTVMNRVTRVAGGVVHA